MDGQICFLWQGCRTNEKALRPEPEGFRTPKSERRVARPGTSFGAGRCRRHSGLSAAEPADGVGANAPEGGDFRGLRFLGLAVFAFGFRADELAIHKVRPLQSKLCDPKTGEMVDFLFLNRMRSVGSACLNAYLIPKLCRKAGVPQSDIRGRITSHRARSTIATQLFNAKEPMSLYELQEWLGHRLPSSTQRYAKITPTKLMKSYSDAGYFGRNLRAIEVLIDQEKVRAGVGVEEAWKFYDLGHGYCTYDFFDQCPHRMACAKCSFYVPKESTAAALLEGKSNLLRMRQEIPLSEAELAALDDGVSALESLLSRLADVPTPAGQTPLQLSAEYLVQIDARQAADRSLNVQKGPPTMSEGPMYRRS
jgi:hypothetical protein